jgi:hypothetical protein
MTTGWYAVRPLSGWQNAEVPQASRESPRMGELSVPPRAIERRRSARRHGRRSACVGRRWARDRALGVLGLSRSGLDLSLAADRGRSPRTGLLELRVGGDGKYRPATVMTQKKDAIEVVDRYLRAGGSVCPYAKTATIHYASDNEALGPTLLALGNGEASVVVATKAAADFGDLKRWAQDTVLSLFVAATTLAYPTAQSLSSPRREACSPTPGARRCRWPPRRTRRRSGTRP